MEPSVTDLSVVDGLAVLDAIERLCEAYPNPWRYTSCGSIGLTPLIDSALCALPTFTREARAILERHREHPDEPGTCSFCPADWAFSTDWPCPEVRSVLAMIEPYKALVQEET